MFANGFIRFNALSLVGLILPFFISIDCANASTITRFSIIDSSPSSWVARGYDNYTVAPSNGWTFTPSRNFDNGVSFRLTGTPLPGTNVSSWSLDFAAPLNALLTPGLYSNVQRFPFQDSNRPGLGFGSTNRGDNQVAGSFEVLEATYSPTGTVLSFSANFTHYGETNPANYAIGEIRFNSSTVPEPSTAAVVVGLCLTMVGWRANKFDDRSI